ncbi:MAG: hypothetical protein ABEK59_04780 [Halobacteria archaeon]
MESVETIYQFYENTCTKYNLEPLETGDFIDLMMELYPALVPDTEVINGQLKPVYLNAELEDDEYLTVYDREWDPLTPEQSLKFYRGYGSLEELRHLKHFLVTISEERKAKLPEIWRKTNLVNGYDNCYRSKVDIVDQWILETNIEANEIEKVEFGRKFGEQIPLSDTARSLLKSKIRSGEIDSNTTVYSLFNIEEISSTHGRKIQIGVYDDGEISRYQVAKWRLRKKLGQLEAKLLNKTDENGEVEVKPADVERMDEKELNSLIEKSREKSRSRDDTEPKPSPKKDEKITDSGVVEKEDKAEEGKPGGGKVRSERKRSSERPGSSQGEITFGEQGSRNRSSRDGDKAKRRTSTSTGNGSESLRTKEDEGQNRTEHPGINSTSESVDPSRTEGSDGKPAVKDGEDIKDGKDTTGTTSSGTDVEPVVSTEDVKNNLMSQDFKDLQEQAEKHGVDKYGSREEMADGIIEKVDMESLKERMKERKKKKGLV